MHSSNSDMCDMHGSWDALNRVVVTRETRLRESNSSWQCSAVHGG